MDFEINHIRQITMQMVSDGDFGSQYTFYYDETNNIRKFLFISTQKGTSISFQKYSHDDQYSSTRIVFL